MNLIEPALRQAVLESFARLPREDVRTLFAAAKGLMEQRALADPEDVAPVLASLDALLAYFQQS